MPETKVSAKTKFEIKLGAATREAFGRALVELGRENKDVVAVDADLSKSSRLGKGAFQTRWPDRISAARRLQNYGSRSRSPKTASCQN